MNILINCLAFFLQINCLVFFSLSASRSRDHAFIINTKFQKQYLATEADQRGQTIASKKNKKKEEEGRDKQKGTRRWWPCEDAVAALRNEQQSFVQKPTEMEQEDQ